MMTTPEILDLLPNPEHLREVRELLRENRSRGDWDDWLRHALILEVWAERLNELIEKLTKSSG